MQSFTCRSSSHNPASCSCKSAAKACSEINAHQIRKTPIFAHGVAFSTVLSPDPWTTSLCTAGELLMFCCRKQSSRSPTCAYHCCQYPPPKNEKKNLSSIWLTMGDAGVVFPRLKAVQFPLKVRALPHVMKHTVELAILPREAAMEAGRSGQVAWLKQLLPRILINKDAVARQLVGSAPHSATTRSSTPRTGGRRIATRGASIRLCAIEGGHLDAVECLLGKYLWDKRPALEQALRCDRQDMAMVLCARSGQREFL